MIPFFDTKGSATCIIEYQVDGKTYNNVNTCGADGFDSGERAG